MNPINNYRFGSYAILAMGLINLRYQTGNDQNFAKSSLLIISGLIGFGMTFIPAARNLLIKKITKILSVGLLIGLIAYGFLI
jgi:hypothetical protein